MVEKFPYEEIKKQFRDLKKVDFEHNQHVKTLLRNRRLFSELIENSGNLIFIKDVEGKYRLVNYKWEETTGLNREFALGKTDEMLFPVKIARQFQKNDFHVFESGSTIEMEEILNTPSGLRYFISNKFPLFNEDKKITGLCGIITDITERKKAENALSESETKYRILTRSMKDVIIQLSSEGNLLFVSPNIKAFGGYDAEYEIGNHITKYFEMEADLLRVIELLEKVLKTHQSGIFEFLFKPKNKNPFPVEYTYFPIIKDNKVSAIQLVLRDITERKHAEKKLQDHILFLERLRTIDRFFFQPTNLEKLIDNVLNVTLSIFDCDRVWLLYPCDPEASSWRVPIEKTKPEYQSAGLLNKDYAMTPDVENCFRNLLATKEPLIAELKSKESDWDPEGKFGVRSVMSIAIHPRKGIPWNFSLQQCSHTRIWTKADQRLFKEISRRITKIL